MDFAQEAENETSETFNISYICHTHNKKKKLIPNLPAQRKEKSDDDFYYQLFIFLPVIQG